MPNISVNSTGSTTTGAPNAGGVDQNRRLSTNNWLYLENGTRQMHTRGDQKLLELGYNKLTLYHTCCHFFTYSHATSMHIFDFCSQLVMP